MDCSNAHISFAHRGKILKTRVTGWEEKSEWREERRKQKKKGKVCDGEYAASDRTAEPRQALQHKPC